MRATRLIIFTLFASVALLALLIPIMARPVAARSPLSPSVTQPALTPLTSVSSDKAFQHLEQVMDKCHLSFVVYADLDSPCNHFAHQARLESFGQTTMDVAFTQTVHSGSTAIKLTFSGQSWGGWYLQNGVLLPGNPAPISNWGTYSNAGYSLIGATELTFYAKGAKGGERVEFFAFGVGRNPDTGLSNAPFPDSEAKVTLCGRLISPCYITLTNTWQSYTIPLTGLDLSYVLGSFGWVTNDAQNSNQSITFYLDDIQYNGPSRLNDPRFLVSFETISTTPVISFDIVNKNVAFTYDIALALIAFTAAGNRDRATLLADAFVYCQAHDRFYDNDRLRNAYMAGDLTTPPGWNPNGREGTCRLPGWTDKGTGEWRESAEHGGSGTGNLAWVMLALLDYYEKWGGEEYLTSVITLGNWIETHTRDTRGAGGYTGGYEGWEPTPIKLLWKSTEHNLDLYVALKRLCLITGDEIWCERAEHARNFAEAMWNEEEGFYWTGTGEDGVTINKTVIPLDGQTWSLMAFSINGRTQRAIDYAEVNHDTIYNYTYSGGDVVLEGFDFNTDRDMPWPEGTGQMVVAYWLLEEDENALYFLNELRELQAKHPNGNSKGIVAAPDDGLTTGFNWEYFARLHVGATAWFIFAERKYNPYWPPSLEVYLPMIFNNY